MSNIFEHGYALVVGVDANQIPRLALDAVAKDVQAVYDVLVHPERCAYNPDNVKFLRGEESTRENIMGALYWLQGKVKEDAEATAVLYYSGHGMEDKATSQYYLIPYDIKELSRVRAYAIRAEDFSAEVSAIGARRMLAILDCCHAAGMDVKDVEVTAVESTAFPLELPETKDIPTLDVEPGGKAVSDLADGEGRAILNSSTGGQSSYVRTDGAMSLFTYHLIEALTGHAPHPDDASVVYVTDVMSWVTHKVKRSAKEQGRDQTPVMRTSGVFPVAMLIGGQGVAKGLGGTPPDPLASLPDPSVAVEVGHAEGSIFVGDTSAGGDLAGGAIHKQEGDIYQGNVDRSTHVAGPQITASDNATFGQIGDNVNLSGGDFVKGDKNIQGDEIHGDKVSGDKVGGSKISVGNISNAQGIAIGDGAQVTLSHVQQQIGNMSNPNDAEKEALQNLIKQLEAALAKVPAAHKDDAEAVSQTTEALVAMAASEKPNKTMLQITGEGLKQAARNLAEITPDVLAVATSIVGTVLKLTGMG